MTKSIKMMAALIAAAILLVSFTACGKKEEVKGETKGETQAVQSSTAAVDVVQPGNPALPIVSKPTTFKLWIPTSNDIANTIKTLDNSEYYKEMEKRTGVHIEFIHPTISQEQQSLNLLIASGDLPDIVQMATGSYEYPGGMDKAITDGTFLKLNDLIGKFAPNYLKLINSSADVKKQTMTDSGSLAGFYNVALEAQPPWFGMVVRQDWLDELGLKTPVTYDDWYVMLKAFKEKKGAVAPMMLNYTGFSNFDVFNAGYGVSQKFYQVDSKVKYGPLESGYKEYLVMINKWYKEGLIDKDFITKKDFIPTATFTTTNKAGAWNDVYILLSVDKMKAAATTPNYRVVAVPSPVLKAGDKLHLRQTNFVTGMNFWALSKSCSDPETATKWIDYIFSPDGVLLSNYGIKDKTYTVGADGKPVFTEFMTKNPEGLSLGQAIIKYTKHPSGPVEYHWEREWAGQPKDNTDAPGIWSKDNDGAYYLPSAITLTSDEGTEFAQIMGDINTYVSEMNIKFILGTEPMTKYDEFVSRIKSMNIDRAVALEQAALDRYYARK